MTAPGKKNRPPRIVILADEFSCGQTCHMLIQREFRDATILTFQNPEMLPCDPDLLIIDLGMPVTGNVLISLAKKAVKYPILVLLAAGRLFDLPAGEAEIRRCVGKVLNLSIMAKPFGAGSFRSELIRLLSVGENAVAG